MPRLIIDISTLARWHGPPVGIPRCQMKYADYALRIIPDAVFTIFDPRLMRYRPLSRDHAAAIIAGRMKPEMSMMPDPAKIRKRTIDSVPQALRPAYWWFTKFRLKVLELLEDRRLASTSPAFKRTIGRWQDRWITKKLRGLYYDSAGGRIDRPSLDGIAGAPLDLIATDTTLAMQFDWSHTNIAAIAAMRRGAGSRHVVLCHDLIPILFPQWYSARDVTLFGAYYAQAFAAADRVIFTSNCTARDAEAYCRSIGVAFPEARVAPMGTDVVERTAFDAALPDGLSDDRYILFVSTIEPRKNHRMLLDAWKRLAQAGTVAATGFKLVFVGRPGWMMGTVLDDIGTDPDLAGTVVHLTGVSDATLATLYRHAAFCVYPPLYEGYGLPPVEALAAGKAVIASSAGPIAEIVGDFAVCLDPTDLDAWTDRMGQWMSDPTERIALAARAAADYAPISWEAAAQGFFEAVQDRSADENVSSSR